MTAQIISNLNHNAMDKKEIKAQAEAFCANPRSYRKSEEGVKEFSSLAAPVQAKAREILEGRRGFRRVNGSIELSKEAIVAHIARLKAKRDDMEARLPLIDARVAELEDELSERFGETNE